MKEDNMELGGRDCQFYDLLSWHDTWSIVSHQMVDILIILVDLQPSSFFLGVLCLIQLNFKELVVKDSYLRWVSRRGGRWVVKGGDLNGSINFLGFK